MPIYSFLIISKFFKNFLKILFLDNQTFNFDAKTAKFSKKVDDAKRYSRFYKKRSDGKGSNDSSTMKGTANSSSKTNTKSKNPHLQKTLEVIEEGESSRFSYNHTLRNQVGRQGTAGYLNSKRSNTLSQIDSFGARKHSRGRESIRVNPNAGSEGINDTPLISDSRKSQEAAIQKQRGKIPLGLGSFGGNAHKDLFPNQTPSFNLPSMVKPGQPKILEKYSGKQGLEDISSEQEHTFLLRDKTDLIEKLERAIQEESDKKNGEGGPGIGLSGVEDDSLLLNTREPEIGTGRFGGLNKEKSFDKAGVNGEGSSLNDNLTGLNDSTGDNFFKENERRYIQPSFQKHEKFNVSHQKK